MCDVYFHRRLDDNRPLREFLEERDIKLNMTEEELNGPERFAIDNVITQEDCEALIHLANVRQIVIGRNKLASSGNEVDITAMFTY